MTLITEVYNILFKGSVSEISYLSFSFYFHVKNGKLFVNVLTIIF